MYIRHRRIILRKINKIGISYVFVSLGLAFVSTIWAIFLESFLHNASSVGLLSSLFTIIGILSYILLIPLVEKSNKVNLLIISSLLFAISYFILAVYSNVYLVIILGIVIAIFASLKITVFGLIVRDNSQDKNVSKNEGIVYSLLNIAWFIGPLIAGYISRLYGFKWVFFFAGLLILFSLFLIKYFKIKDNRKNEVIDHHFKKILFDFFSRKNRTFAYIISGAITFWWALIYVYIPVYIIESGFHESLVGIFLSAVILPLILLEYKFGKLAGRIGFKKLFVTGYLILAAISIISFLLSGNLYILLILLVLGSVGVAMIESTSEAYFFDIVKENDRDRFYGIYNTAVDIGYFFGTLPAALILLFLPFKFIFLFFALAMIVIAYISLKIKDVYEYKK